MGCEPLLIAVVDDDAEVRQAIARLLCAAGYCAETFASGEAFLSSVTHRAPDCVVLDVHMPGMNGHEVQERLLPSHAGMPVILITGRDSPELRSHASRSGANSYLLKPVDQETLLDAIHAAIVH
jgi:FixJ family two-component response regulator